MVSPFPFRAKLKVKLSVTLATRYVPSVLDSSLPLTFIIADTDTAPGPNPECRTVATFELVLIETIDVQLTNPVSDTTSPSVAALLR